MNARETNARPSAWCLFESCSRHWAVPLENVAEIISVDRLVRMPLCSPDLLGLCTLRREVIPVFWPVHHPGEPESMTPAHVVLILRVAQGLWGMPIVREGTVVLEEEVGVAPPFAAPTPAGASGGADASGSDEGAILRGKQRYQLLDPELAWHEARRSIERWYGRGVARPSAAVLHEAS